MMIGERTLEGWVVLLRPRGVGRFFTAAFLSFWLCGWAIGEGFVLWFLIKGGRALLTGTPPDPGRDPLELAPSLAVGAFLLFWLTFWTLGGIAAIGALLQLLWGEDRMTVGSTGLAVEWRRGPFRWMREYPRDRLRGIDVFSRKGTLTLETDRERVELSALGTPAEREEAAEALRSELGLQAPRRDVAALPIGWEETITPEGERAVVKDVGVRRVQTRVAAIAALGVSAIAFLILREAVRQPALLPFALITAGTTAALIWGAAWLAYGRMELRVGAGVMTVRRRFRGHARDVFEARRLELTSRSDSDGDDWFTLEAVAGSADAAAMEPSLRKPPKLRRTIVSAMNDRTVPHHLGAWLARTTGMPLLDRTTAEARDADVAALVHQLGQAGPLGRAASLLIRKAHERRDKRPTG